MLDLEEAHDSSRRVQAAKSYFFQNKSVWGGGLKGPYCSPWPTLDLESNKKGGSKSLKNQVFLQMPTRAGAVLPGTPDSPSTVGLHRAARPRD